MYFEVKNATATGEALANTGQCTCKLIQNNSLHL